MGRHATLLSTNNGCVRTCMRLQNRLIWQQISFFKVYARNNYTYFKFYLSSETARVEDRESRSVLISGRYKILLGGSFPPPPVLIEHCCLMTEGNTWDIAIKCRPILHVSSDSSAKNSWRNVEEVYPGAKIEEKHNDIQVTLPSLREDIEVAAFGTPRKDDQKRMQMAIFGRNPTQGSDWKIRIYLLDDTITAVKVIHCKQKHHISCIPAEHLERVHAVK